MGTVRNVLLLISENVEPPEMLLMYSRFSSHQNNTYRFGNRLLQTIAMNPWLIAVGTVVMDRYPIGARDDISTVPAERRPELIFFTPSADIFLAVSSNTGDEFVERSFGVAQQYSPLVQ